jgi:hypothetical protein
MHFNIILQTISELTMAIYKALCTVLYITEWKMLRTCVAFKGFVSFLETPFRWV